MANSTFKVKKSLQLVASDSGGELGIIYQDDGAGAINRIWNNIGGVFLGDLSGNLANSGDDNVGIGQSAMDALTSGAQNVAVGSGAAGGVTQAQDNVMIGYQAGLTIASGGENVMVGSQAGSAGAAGLQGCVHLGYQAGQNNATDERLYIDNTGTANPLIYGEFDNGFVKINGDAQITGNLTVDGTTTTTHSEEVNIDANYLNNNQSYTTAVAQTGGLTVNYLPTATTASVIATGFSAGGAGGPEVEVTAASGFAQGDIIMIAGANDPVNDGLYEVEAYAGTTLEIRGAGGTSPVEDWSNNDFVTDTTVAGTVTKVNLSVIRCGTDGAWEVGLGAATPLAFVDLAAGSGPWTEGPVGTIYPTTFATDDVIIGANATVGTERLRVAGDVLIDTNSTLTVADSATAPPVNLTERSAAPSAPATDDIYLDDGTNYGGGSGNPGFMRWTGAAWEDIGDNGLVASPWTEAAGIIYPTTHATDDVVIGTNTMSGVERFRVYGSSAATAVSARIEAVITGGTPTTVSALDLSVVPSGGTTTFGYGMRVGVSGIGGGALTTMYGIEIADLTTSGSTATAYGIYINDQNATTGYGIYQAGNDDFNVFLGDVAVGANAMVGTEKLLISGDVLINSNSKLLIATSATEAPLNIVENGTAPSSPAAEDIYLDDGSNWGTGAGVPGFMRYTGAAWESIAFEGSGGDIPETSFNMTESTGPANVTGLLFGATVRSFHALVSVITTTTVLGEMFVLDGVYDGTNWMLTVTGTGDDALVSFTITNAGQVQYTSGSWGGGSGTCKFRAITTTV